MRAVYGGQVFELDDYETELAQSEDMADKLFLQIRLEIRKAGGDPDTAIVTEMNYDVSDVVKVKNVEWVPRIEEEK